MRQFNFKLKDTPLLKQDLQNFAPGLNKLVSNTQLQPNELSEAMDIQIIEDGKIQCPREGQAYYGSESGTRVTGLAGYYKSDGTQKLIRSAGTTLQYYNAGNWSNIAGYAYTTGLRTNMVTAYDKLYVSNGTDPLTYYDGTSISSFTEISAPTITSVTRTSGSDGTYTFSYKVTAVTAAGETTPSAASTATASIDTLTESVYMTVLWGAVTNAIGYNVYGRKDGAWYFLAYLEGNGSVSWADKGTATPQAYFPPPEGNTTGGPKGKYVALYKDTLFIFGDPNNPSRLYYSGGGDKIHDFSVASGGGFIDISKNDGTVGTGLIVFKNTLIVFKEDSIYQFSFETSGLPSVTQVNPSIGAIAPRSIIMVENDVFFASRRGIFTVGNEPGFSFDTLRTNEISARVRPIYQTIDTNYLENIAGIYATSENANLVIFAYTPSGSTTNSKALVFDRERGGWVEWSNIQANCWVQYIDTDGSAKVLYGDDASGYVKQILTGTDDFGSAIHGYFKTLANPFDSLNSYKTLKDIDIILRNPVGSFSLDIVIEGVNSAKTVNMATVSPSVNWGHYTFTDFLFAESQGTGVSTQDENILKTLRNLNLEGRSFLLGFDNNSSARFVLLEIHEAAKAKSARYRKSDDIVAS